MIIDNRTIEESMIMILYNRGGQREETREPPNVLINVEEPKCKKGHIIMYINSY